MGKSSSIVTGYHYRPAMHIGLGRGPFDAYLAWTIADKYAWQGELTASGIVTISKPFLFGGKKDQGGVEGDLELMFGEATQMPNAYLSATFGPQQPAWRGLTTMVWKGGRYGANNPYAQKNASKIRKILKGWDNDDPWYPEKAEITLALIQSSKRDWRHLVIDNTDGTDYSSPVFDDSGWALAAAPFGDREWDPDFWAIRPSDYGFDNQPDTHVDAEKRIWVRTSINLPVVPPSMRFETFIDNECDFYINGSLAASVSDASLGNFYHDVAIDTGLLQTGVNSIAAKFTDTGLASDPTNYVYFDLRLSSTIPLLGMNPAHMLYYMRTDSERGREPRPNMNEASLTAAADRLHAEGFGLCTEYDPANESPSEFEQRICRVIGGSFERSIVDGEWYVDLARGDYDIESLPVLTDDDILDFKEQPTTLDRAVNSLSVRYFDPEKKETIVTPAVRALGLVRKFGEIHETLDFPEIPTASLALRVAERELRARVTPTHGFKLVTTPRTYAWRRNQYFRLQSVKRGIADMVCIVGQKTRGTLKSGAIDMIATQDIYSLPDTSYVDIEPGVDTTPPQTPQVIDVERAFEAPYVEVASVLPGAQLDQLSTDAGFVMAVASDPLAGMDFTMSVAPSGGDFVEAGSGYWCPTATTLGVNEPGDLVIGLDATYRLADVELGSPVLWDDELGRVDAVDTVLKTVTLGRGCGDTVSARHSAGSRLWFYDGYAAQDTTEYTDGETVEVKLLSNTGSQQLPVGLATAMPITLDRRVSRPYPPGLLTIDGAAYPASVDGSFIVTWAHRNRVTQADQLVDASVASVTPAPNTRYGLRFRRVDTNAVLVERTDIGPGTATIALNYTGDVRLELWTIDNEGVSWQSHLHEFAYTGAVGNSITATAYTPVDDATVIDGGGDP